MDLTFDSKLGRGAFGDVWLAIDTVLDRSVAVKFFNDTTPSLAEQNAINHAKALARVAHPAVVQVYSLERQPHPESGESALAIVMEYVDGFTLSKHKGDLSREHARSILSNMADALEALHGAGLVHGDLHDGNVLVTGTGAKLIDILYTHSLADVGTKTAARTRDDDIRAFAIVARQVTTKARCEVRLVEDAHFRAATQAHIPRDVLDAFVAVFTTSAEAAHASKDQAKLALESSNRTDATKNRDEVIQRADEWRGQFNALLRAGSFHRLPPVQRGIVALSLFPDSPFAPRLDVQDIKKRLKSGPLAAGGWNYEYTGRALVLTATFSGQDTPWSVLEFADWGGLRAACVSLLNPQPPDARWQFVGGTAQGSVPSVAFERDIIKGATQYLNELRSFGANGDIYIGFSLLNIQDAVMAVDPTAFRRPLRVYVAEDIVPDTVCIPRDVHVPDFQTLATMFRPSFDYVWREYGFERSFNYSAAGQWGSQG